MPRPKTWGRRGKPHTSACATASILSSQAAQRAQACSDAMPVPLFPAACCGTCTACIRCAASLSCHLALLALSLRFCLAECQQAQISVRSPATKQVCRADCRISCSGKSPFVVQAVVADMHCRAHSGGCLQPGRRQPRSQP